MLSRVIDETRQMMGPPDRVACLRKKRLVWRDREVNLDA
jgi:hypothetical protein